MGVSKIRRRRFQDTLIWLEIISLPYKNQKKIRDLQATEKENLKTLVGSCCNVDMDYIKEDYYNEKILAG